MNFKLTGMELLFPVYVFWWYNIHSLWNNPSYKLKTSGFHSLPDMSASYCSLTQEYNQLIWNSRTSIIVGFFRLWIKMFVCWVLPCSLFFSKPWMNRSLINLHLNWNWITEPLQSEQLLIETYSWTIRRNSIKNNIVNVWFSGSLRYQDLFRAGWKKAAASLWWYFAPCSFA